VPSNLLEPASPFADTRSGLVADNASSASQTLTLPLLLSLSLDPARGGRAVLDVHALSIPWPWAHARERASLIARLYARIVTSECEWRARAADWPRFTACARNMYEREREGRLESVHCYQLLSWWRRIMRECVRGDYWERGLWHVICASRSAIKRLIKLGSIDHSRITNEKLMLIDSWFFFLVI